MLEKSLLARAKMAKRAVAASAVGALALTGVAVGASSANADAASTVVLQPTIGAETASSYPANPWFVGYNSSHPDRGTTMDGSDLSLNEDTQLLYQLPAADKDLTLEDLVSNGLGAGVDSGDMTFQIVVTWTNGAGSGFTTLRSSDDSDTTAALGQTWYSSKQVTPNGGANTVDTLGNLISDIESFSGGSYSIPAVGIYGGETGSTPNTDVSDITINGKDFTFAGDVDVTKSPTSTVKLSDIGIENDANGVNALPTPWFYGENADTTGPHGYVSNGDLVLTSTPSEGTQFLHQLSGADALSGPLALEQLIDSGLSYTIDASPAGTASFQLPLTYGAANHYVTLRTANDLGAGTHDVHYADDWTSSHDILDANGHTLIAGQSTHTLAQLVSAIESAGGSQNIEGFGLQATQGTTPAVANIQGDGVNYTFSDDSIPPATGPTVDVPVTSLGQEDDSKTPSYPTSSWFYGDNSDTTTPHGYVSGDDLYLTSTATKGTQLLHQFSTGAPKSVEALVASGLSYTLDSGTASFQIPLFFGPDSNPADAPFTTLRTANDLGTGTHDVHLGDSWTSSANIGSTITKNQTYTLAAIIQAMETVEGATGGEDVLGFGIEASVGSTPALATIQGNGTKYDFVNAAVAAGTPSVVKIGSIGQESPTAYPTNTWFYGNNLDRTTPHGYISGTKLVLTSTAADGTQLLRQFSAADEPSSLAAFLGSGLSYTVASSTSGGTASFQIPLTYGLNGTQPFFTTLRSEDLGVGVHDVNLGDDWISTHDIGSTITHDKSYPLASILSAIEAAGGTETLFGFGVEATPSTTPAISSITAAGTTYTFGDGDTSATPSLSSLSTWTQSVDPTQYDWSTTTVKGIPTLQMSNWVADPSADYGNISELNTPTIADAGKPDASSAEYNTFTANLTVSARTFDAQPGLAVEVSADKGGDRSGGSILLRHDANDKLTISNFSLKPGASDADLTSWVSHSATVSFTKAVAITFVDHFEAAQDSDIVSVYANGKLVLTGGTYEGYERILGSGESHGGFSNGSVDSLLFRAGHTIAGTAKDPNGWEQAAPTAAQAAGLKGNGFYFSNISYSVSNSIALKTPTITGTAKVGAKLTAAAVADVDGTSSTYQWYANGSKVPTNGTSATYTVGKGELGKHITVAVTSAEGQYSSDSALSAQTAAIGLGDFVSGSVVIDGTQAVGDKLTAVTTTSPAASYAYQWYRGSARISGATKSTYTLVAADLSQQIKVRATAHTADYADGVLTSTVTSAIGLGTFSLATPTISGTFKVGKTLTAKATASITGTTKHYEWFVGASTGAPAQIGLSDTFKIPAYAAGSSVSVTVLAYKTGYEPGFATVSEIATIS